MIRDACASQIVPKAFATAKAALLTLIEPTAGDSSKTDAGASAGASPTDTDSASGADEHTSTTINPVGSAALSGGSAPSWASGLGDPASISLIRTKSANEVPIHYEGLTLLKLADADPYHYEDR